MDTGDRVIIERYPTDKLPDGWEKGRSLGPEVRVVLERIPPPDEEDLPLARILEEMQNRRVFSGDPVQRIRALRAEWDHRDELHDRIRAGDA
jgi:xanthine/CO dehydrogenase XdhC/CoxF family maturation factor